MLGRLRLRSWQNAARAVSRLRGGVPHGTDFSTSTRKLDASYSNWFTETSKSISLFGRAQNAKGKAIDERASKSEAEIPPDLKVLRRDDVESIEILKMKADGKLDLISEKLQLLRADSKVLEPELILEVLDEPSFADATLWFREVGTQLPIVDSFMFMERQVLFELSAKLKHHNSILRLYEDIMIWEPAFQRYFIQTAFHLNDFEKLQQLANIYLVNPVDSNTIAYIIQGFALNYEVEAAKEIFINVCGMRQDLDITLLETTFITFIEAHSLFDNFMHILQAWILSRNATPSEKAMTLILAQCYRFGTPLELREIDNLVHRYGLGDGAMINMTKLKYHISSRNKLAFKKIVLEDDIIIFNNIARSLLEEEKLEELVDFYYSMASYFARYSDLKYVELVFYKMRQDGVALDQRFYRLLSRRYVKHENFLQLLRFLKASQPRMQFHYRYLVDVFECFVKTYPHYAEAFAQTFRSWAEKHEVIDEHAKQVLLNALKINRLESALAPIGFGDKLLNTKKYPSGWVPINWERDHQGRAVRCWSQVEFRVEKGFKDLVSRGVRPDFTVIENTFRRADLLYKTRILELAQTIRMEQKHQNRLSMINLAFATKYELKKFFKYNLDTLNSNDKIVFGRILDNMALLEEARAVLESVDDTELNDKSYLVILNFTLRVAVRSNDMETFLQKLDAFPLTEVTLSPYLLKHCIYIEKELNKKLEHTANPEKIETALQRLRRFIGDAQKILDKDKQELQAKVKDMFGFLDAWITTND